MTGSGTEASSSSAGGYTRLAEVASGGMGRVDVALRQQGSFRRLYAIKRLHAHSRDDEAFRTMFLDEARIAGLVRHPNVVSVLDVGEDEDGPFLVMDYVEGVSASALVRRLKKRNEPLPVQLALRIVVQAARGLHAAHELADHDGQPLSLVHRDVSPSNVLIGFDGVVRVTDFGIAKALGRRTRTDSGVLKGKLGYMSPEQLRFRDPDRRSDIFALGIVLYELIAGRRLYGNEDKSPAPLRILEEPVPDLGDERVDLPPALVEMGFRMLAKEAHNRPDTAQQVADELDAIERALAAAEGRLDLGELVARCFASEREARNAAINDRIERLDSVVELPAAGAPSVRPMRRYGPRTLAIVAAASAAAVVMAAGWVLLSQPGADSNATVPNKTTRAGLAAQVLATGEGKVTPTADHPSTASSDPSKTEPETDAPKAEATIGAAAETVPNTTNSATPSATQGTSAKRGATGAKRGATGRKATGRKATGRSSSRQRARRRRKSRSDSKTDRIIWSDWQRPN